VAARAAQSRTNDATVGRLRRPFKLSRGVFYTLGRRRRRLLSKVYHAAYLQHLRPSGGRLRRPFELSRGVFYTVGRRRRRLLSILRRICNISALLVDSCC
jgi:hypothetical protein